MAKDSVQGMELVNLKELDKLLSALPVDLQAKIWRSANRKAAKIALDKMKANIPGPYSDEVKNIRIASDKYNKSGVLVGIHPDGFKLRWVEYGTAQRETKGGANRGKIQPQPFIKKSIDESESQILDFVKKEYGTIINKAIESRIKSTLRKIKKLNS